MKIENVVTGLPENCITENRIVNISHNQSGRYIILNDPVSNILSLGLGQGEFDLPLNNRHKITGYTLITDEGVTTASCGRRYTPYDRCIYNAVCTLWAGGNKLFTPTMIYRTMTNMCGSARLSKSSVESINESLAKLCDINVQCDVSAQLSYGKKGSSSLNGGYIDDRLLYLEPRDAYIGGNRVTVYLLKREPILFTYASLLKEIVNVNAQLLDIKVINDGCVTEKSVSNTMQRQIVKEYLLARIVIMKNDRRQKHGKQSNRILFESLYKNTETDEKSKQEKARIRQYVFQALDFWSKCVYTCNHKPFIYGYNIQKEHGMLRAVDICLDERLLDGSKQCCK